MGLEYTQNLSEKNINVLKEWKLLFNHAYSNLMVEEDFLKDKSDLAYCHYRVAREYNRINVNKTVSDALTLTSLNNFKEFLIYSCEDESLQIFKEAMLDYVCEELDCKEKKLHSFLEELQSSNCITFEKKTKYTKVVKSCFEFTNIYLLNLEE